jgi:hypothetical protein
VAPPHHHAQCDQITATTTPFSGHAARAQPSYGVFAMLQSPNRQRQLQQLHRPIAGKQARQAEQIGLQADIVSRLNAAECMRLTLSSLRIKRCTHRGGSPACWYPRRWGFARCDRLVAPLPGPGGFHSTATMRTLMRGSSRLYWHEYLLRAFRCSSSPLQPSRECYFRRSAVRQQVAVQPALTRRAGLISDVTKRDGSVVSVGVFIFA